MTASIQQLRGQAEAGIANGVQTANTALQQIAQINQQLLAALAGQLHGDARGPARPGRDAARAADERQCRAGFQQSNLGLHRDRSATGRRIAGRATSFNDVGALSATSQWSANPSQDSVGTITLTSPGGTSTDLIATNAIQSGQIGAYIQMRDSILPQAQAQLDELANQMSQALSNRTTSGTRRESGSQAGFTVDVGALSPGNTVQLTYTDAQNNSHTVTIVALGAGGALPAQPANSSNPVVGVNFAAGMSAVVSQLNAALGTNLQFSNPSGTVLQVLNNGAGNVVNSLSATSTVTSLQSGSPQLPLFTEDGQPITGAITAGGSQITGLAGTIEVNPRSPPRRRVWPPMHRIPRPAIRRGRISCSAR